MISKYVKFWSLLFALTILSGFNTYAQSILTPRTVGMGGGGTAYLSGYSANFLNPANLLLPEHRYNNQIGIGQLALSLNKQSVNNSIQPYQFLMDQFSPQDVSSFSLQPNENQKILTNWFPDNSQKYRRTARFDAVLFGFNWQNGSQAFSIAFRTLGINKMSVSRGWFDSGFHKINGKQILQRNLNQTIAVFHELSFGFAEQFSLINGWTPRLNRLYIGIAPKLVFGDMYFNGSYQSNYFIGKSADYLNTRSLSMLSTGILSNHNGIYNSQTNQYSFPPNTLNYKDAFKPTGLGAGVDLGFTYVISLGNDTALLHRKKGQALKKSFRISASLTDIGFIWYNKNITSYQLPSDSVYVSSIPHRSTSDFIGSPGTFNKFTSIDDPGGISYNSKNESHPVKKQMALPTALHFGSVLQLNWWMASVDFTYALNSNTFNSKYLITNIGGEFHIIPYLPIRLGVQLQQTHSPEFGIGTAINLPHFEISGGVQINTPGLQHNTFLMSAAVSAIKIRF